MRRLLIAFLCLGLVAIAVSVAGAWLGEDSPYLDLAAQFTLQATIGAAGLILLFLLLKQAPLAILSAIVGVLGFFAVMPRPAVIPCEQAASHKVLFLNIWADNPDPASDIAYLVQSDADVILIAEVIRDVEPLLEPLREKYPYILECPPKEWRCDLFVYSRFPVERDPDKYQTGMLGTSVAFPDGDLKLTGIHLTRPWPFRPPHDQLNQAGRVGTELAKTTDEARLVIGDFNAATWGAIIRRISTAGGVSALPSYGTWHSHFPLILRMPIDQVLTNGVACATKTVGPRLSSDHRPILAEFAFSPGR